MSDAGLEVGDELQVVQLSPCVGGLLRTWSGGPGSGQIWSVPEACELLDRQGQGLLGRTLREENRFREVGLLSPGGTLVLQPRVWAGAEAGDVSFSGVTLQLEPAVSPDESVFEDLRSLLLRAVTHCAGNEEFLIVERGGFDAPFEPFCLHIVTAAEDDGSLSSVIETAPAPRNAKIWAPHIVEGRLSQVLGSPATEATLKVAPLVMMQAIETWGLTPWDLALTFGRR